MRPRWRSVPWVRSQSADRSVGRSPVCRARMLSRVGVRLRPASTAVTDSVASRWTMLIRFPGSVAEALADADIEATDKLAGRQALPARALELIDNQYPVP